jgi:hypothetical protein
MLVFLEAGKTAAEQYSGFYALSLEQIYSKQEGQQVRQPLLRGPSAPIQQN